MFCSEFQIRTLIYTACRNFLPSFQLHFLFQWNTKSEVRVNICFVTSCWCRLECKSGPFLLKSLSVCLVNSVRFVWLLPEHKHIGLSYISLWRRSILNTAHARVVTSLSLHHKQYDIPSETQHEKLRGVDPSLMCDTSLSFFPLGSCEGEREVFTRVWWLLCLWIPLTLNTISFCRDTSWIRTAWCLGTGTH